MTHTHNPSISSQRTSIWKHLKLNWTSALRPIKRVAVAAVFGLAATESHAASYSQQPGLWSDANTWQDGSVPDGSGSVIVGHPVILDIDSGPSTGGLYISNASLQLNPGVTLTVPNAGLLVFGGSSISGPGVIEGAPFSILGLPGGTVTSSFDVSEINVYSGATGTIRQGTAISLFIEPSNIFRVIQEPGQMDGLTLEGNLYFQFDDGTARVDLGFDPGSGLHDWALRWKGDHADYLTGILNTQLTFSGVLDVGIFYDANDEYTYVSAIPQETMIPEPSAFGLATASGLLLGRRRR